MNSLIATLQLTDSVLTIISEQNENLDLPNGAVWSSTDLQGKLAPHLSAVSQTLRSQDRIDRGRQTPELTSTTVSTEDGQIPIEALVSEDDALALVKAIQDGHVFLDALELPSHRVYPMMSQALLELLREVEAFLEEVNAVDGIDNLFKELGKQSAEDSAGKQGPILSNLRLAIREQIMRTLLLLFEDVLNGECDFSNSKLRRTITDAHPQFENFHNCVCEKLRIVEEFAAETDKAASQLTKRFQDDLDFPITIGKEGELCLFATTLLALTSEAILKFQSLGTTLCTCS